MKNIVEFPESHFTRTVVDGMEYLSNEASSMENRHLQSFGERRRGFAVKFDEDDAVVRFDMVKIQTDSEGEVKGWTYFPIYEDGSKYPDHRHTIAVVMND